MDIRKASSFISNLLGLASAVPAFFPFFDQISNLVLVPTSDADKTTFLTLNILFCSFILIFSYLIQYRYRSLVIPAFLLLAGGGILYWYITLVSPISTLVLLGISADVTYLHGYPQLVYKGLYWLSFALLTGAFTTARAFFYTTRLSSPW